MSGIACIITAVRHLRLVRLNCSFLLVRDAIQILGASECELISVIDLRDAYHTLRLSAESQKYMVLLHIMGQAHTFIKDLVWV